LLRGLRGATDVVIALLLIAVLAWCGLLFWGAYSQHRIAILLNREALAELETSISAQLQGPPYAQTAIIEEALVKLQGAQRDLFDGSSMSFLFQFLSLLLITVGAAILSITFRSYKKTREDADSAERELITTRTHLARYLQGHDNTTLLSVKLAWIHVLGRLYPLFEGSEREELRIMLADLHSDVSRHVADAWRDGAGFDERLFIELILDAAMRSDIELKRLRDAADGPERTALSKILTASAGSLDRLRREGPELLKRSKVQWEAILGADAR